MKAIAPLASLLLLAAAADAFAPAPRAPSSTALNHIDTRKSTIPQEIGVWEQTCTDHRGNLAPCAALSGHERRAQWESYAPTHGTPTSYGAVGCPGGGDWCYAGSFGAAAHISDGAEVKKRAATVASALAGLGKGVGGARVDGVGISIGSGANGAGRALPSSSSASGAVMGEDVRDARSSYSPFSHDGRVGSLGEIGANIGGSVGTRSTGAATPLGRPARSAGPPKRYGLGSWQK